VFQLLQQVRIVPVRESERDAGQFELAPGAVPGRAGVSNGFRDAGAVVVGVAVDEVRVRGKQTRGGGVGDVAAVNYCVHALLDHDRQRRLHGNGSAVRVADDGNSHVRLRNYRYWMMENTRRL